MSTIITECVVCGHKLKIGPLGPCKFHMVPGMPEDKAVYCGCRHVSHFTELVVQL